MGWQATEARLAELVGAGPGGVEAAQRQLYDGLLGTLQAGEPLPYGLTEPQAAAVLLNGAVQLQDAAAYRDPLAPFLGSNFTKVRTLRWPPRRRGSAWHVFVGARPLGAGAFTSACADAAHHHYHRRLAGHWHV